MRRLACRRHGIGNRLRLPVAGKKTAPLAQRRAVSTTAGRLKRAGVMPQAYFAPASNHLAMVPRSSSVILVAFPSGMAFCTTTC